MRKVLFFSVLAALMFAAAPAFAQEGAEAASQGGFFFIPAGAAGIALGAGIGTGLIVMGAGRAIGNIGSSAVESIARQPEAGGRIFTSMLLAAALIEGFTLFAVVVTFQLVGKIAGGIGG